MDKAERVLVISLILSTVLAGSVVYVSTTIPLPKPFTGCGSIVVVSSSPGQCIAPSIRECTWTIYYASDLVTVLANFEAVNPSLSNGQSYFASTNFTTVWDNVVNSINGAGGSICLGAGNFTGCCNLAAGLNSTNPFNNLRIEGIAEGATILKLSSGA